MKRRQVISTLIGIHLAAWAAGPAAGHVHRSYQAPRRLLGADPKSVLQKPDMHRSCGHVPPTADERLRRMAELAPFRAKAEAAVRRRTLLQGGIVIRTFWHVNRLGGAPPLLAPTLHLKSKSAPVRWHACTEHLHMGDGRKPSRSAAAPQPAACPTLPFLPFVVEVSLMRNALSCVPKTAFWRSRRYLYLPARALWAVPRLVGLRRRLAG